MLDFNFYSPTKFYFGREREKEVGKVLKEWGGTRVLLHSSGGSSEKSGLMDRVRQAMDAEGIYYVELKGVVPNPRLSLVREGIELCRKEQLNFVLAVGGGSVVDSAKAIALGANYDGDVWDFYSKGIKAGKVLPIGTIITLAATGSEASNSSVITNTDDPDNWIKTGFNADEIRPTFSIMNPELTFSLPNYQKAAGATDIMAHALERYLTNTVDVDLTDKLTEGLIQSVLSAIQEALADSEDYEAHATLMWAGTLAHNNLLGLGREQDWASHQIEHQISAHNDMTHGAGLAVVMPAFMAYTLDKHVDRYYLFATRVMGVQPNPYRKKDTAKEGIRRYRDFLRSIGMPTTLEEIGLKEEDLPQVIKGVRKNNGDKTGYLQPLTEEDIVEMLKLAV
jgi:alcohol dehydrogenase YqhD (iron-dependent ADH family)